MILVGTGSELVLGVKQIDEHHEQLVNILNRCYHALMPRNHDTELRTVINELRGYAHYHFETERELMADLAIRERPRISKRMDNSPGPSWNPAQVP